MCSTLARHFCSTQILCRASCSTQLVCRAFLKCALKKILGQRWRKERGRLYSLEFRNFRQDSCPNSAVWVRLCYKYKFAGQANYKGANTCPNEFWNTLSKHNALGQPHDQISFSCTGIFQRYSTESIGILYLTVCNIDQYCAREKWKYTTYYYIISLQAHFLAWVFWVAHFRRHCVHSFRHSMFCLLFLQVVAPISH